MNHTFPRSKTWRLRNTELMAEAYPNTFKIPSTEVRNNMKENEHVQLVFKEGEDLEMPVPERMWVRITGRYYTDDGKGIEYIGLLDQDPAFMTGIKDGDEVTFGPEHICKRLVNGMPSTE